MAVQSGCNPFQRSGPACRSLLLGQLARYDGGPSAILTLRRSFREWHYTLKWIAAAICTQWQSQTLRCMRIHLAWFAKRRERAYYRHRAFNPSTFHLGNVKRSTSALTRSF